MYYVSGLSRAKDIVDYVICNRARDDKKLISYLIHQGYKYVWLINRDDITDIHIIPIANLPDYAYEIVNFHTGLYSVLPVDLQLPIKTRLNVFDNALSSLYDIKDKFSFDIVENKDTGRYSVKVGLSGVSLFTVENTDLSENIFNLSLRCVFWLNDDTLIIGYNISNTHSTMLGVQAIVQSQFCILYFIFNKKLELVGLYFEPVPTKVNHCWLDAYVTDRHELFNSAVSVKLNMLQFTTIEYDLRTMRC